MNPEEIVAAWLEMPRITDGMTELQDLIEGIRDYGDARAAEMREQAAQIADQKRLGSCDAREIADAIRALPTTPSPPERPAR